MNELLDTLFGLGELGFGDEGVGLSWARSIPGWGWALIVLASAGAAWWSYRRLSGPAWARSVLGVMRGVLLVVLAALIAGPQLSRTNERIERGWVVFLVDRSASMRTPDAQGPDGSRRTREAQLREALSRAWPRLGEMGARRRVLWLGFGATAFELAERDSAGGSEGEPGRIGVELGEPDDRRTSLRAAIEEARRRTMGRRLSGIVILSDGASIDEPSRRAMAELRRDRVKIVTVPLGSADPLADLAIREAEAPAEGFLEDVVPVRVVVDRAGSAEGPERSEASGVLRVVDERTELALASQRVRFGESSSIERTLRVRAEREGEQRWRVELVPDGADLIEQNNAARVRVRVVDRPIRLAHFDGYPRWEFRYLRNLLLRESSMRSSSVLLSADRRFVQEGDETLAGVPTSPEEWAPLDVVILGDVRASLLSERQLEQLRDHVAERGAGVLWIGGPGATPMSWRQTPMGDLLPFRASSGRGGVETWETPVTLVPGPAAGRLGVLGATPGGASGAEDSGGGGTTGWAGAVSDPRNGWSRLRWVQRIEPGQLKPAVEVVALARPGERGSGGEMTPAVIAMRYGAGRVVYVATDEIWRWRYGRGEALPERFWVPILRHLARASLGRTDARARLAVSPRVTTTGTPVQMVVRIVDPALAEGAGEIVELRVRSAEEAEPRGPGGVDVAAQREPGATSAPRYVATWVPERPGAYVVSIAQPGMLGGSAEARVEVRTPDDERLRPEADHELLARLRSQVMEDDGITLGPARLGEVAAVIPRDETRVEMPADVEPLWDRPIVLFIVLGMLTGEWVFRRVLSLA